MHRGVSPLTAQRITIDRLEYGFRHGLNGVSPTAFSLEKSFAIAFKQADRSFPAFAKHHVSAHKVPRGTIHFPDGEAADARKEVEMSATVMANHALHRMTTREGIIGEANVLGAGSHR